MLVMITLMTMVAATLFASKILLASDFNNRCSVV